jgi:superfamily I DNA/RNA helicase
LIALLQHVLDYDDLLLYWEQMMQEPSIATDVSDRLDHVLVDVYQDTNRLRVLDLICRWHAPHRNASTKMPLFVKPI